LTILGDGTGFSIVARKPHADELQALFAQHGVAYDRKADEGFGRDLLWFDAADRRQVEQVLESYKLAKGS
jgi:hypothetical protein